MINCCRLKVDRMRTILNVYCVARRFATTTVRNKNDGVLFSGIQPTGVPHLGNYLGALRNWVLLQERFEQPLFSVVDLHALTNTAEPARRRSDIIDTVISLLACGINPEKSILFQQSDVKEHAELCWILTCLTSEARLKQVPQWKEKAKSRQDITLGLIAYPVLMSADILLYKANCVPIGADQLQHIQLCRDLAGIFNTAYGTFFPLCEWVLSDVPRIKSLRDPMHKMSKSDPSEKSRIHLNDSSDDVRRKIKLAVTDNISEVYYSPKDRPGVSNLMDIHAALLGITSTVIEEQAKGLDTGQYKRMVTDVVVQSLKPVQTQMDHLKGNMDYVHQVLASGKTRATEIAAKTILCVKQLIGLK